MTDIPAPAPPPTPDGNPDELLDSALNAQIDAARLRSAAAQPGATVQASDGRLLRTGDILAEAERIEEGAQFEAFMAIALFVEEIRDLLNGRLRNRPLVGDARTGRGFTLSREAPIPYPGDASPEQAPEMPCVIEIYHSNHLWWGRPTDGGVRGAAVTQARYFCPGVRYRRPQPDPEAVADARDAP